MGLCTEGDCIRAAGRRGYCKAHYARAIRIGTIKVERERDPVKRLWSYVRKTRSCWLWTGTVTWRGYGQLYIYGRFQQAHRAVYEEVRGPIPDGLHLDHLCRNRACVRPDHLEPVTAGENLRRGFGASGINGRKTHCINGHEFTTENTVVYPSGTRRCKACARALTVARLARMKSERAVPNRATCLVCGTVFERPNKQVKICSDPCRREATREYQRRYDRRRDPVTPQPEASYFTPAAMVAKKEGVLPEMVQVARNQVSVIGPAARSI
ncbi:MAG: HNH endonuclease signature motif containing protein [Chloroflexota bacterium]